MDKIIGFLFKQFSKFGKMPAFEIMDAARRSKGKYTARQLREGLKKVIARTKVLKPSQVPATSRGKRGQRIQEAIENITKKAPTKGFRLPSFDKLSREQLAVVKDHGRSKADMDKELKEVKELVRDFYREAKKKGKKPKGKKPQGRVLGRTLDDIFAEGRGAPDNPWLDTRAGKTRLQKFWDKRTGGR